MDRDEESSYYRAMLVVTVALAVLASVVAVLVTIFPGDRAAPPAPPAPVETTTPARSG